MRATGGIGSISWPGEGPSPRILDIVGLACLKVLDLLKFVDRRLANTDIQLPVYLSLSGPSRQHFQLTD
jgi:hypothetical protein